MQITLVVYCIAAFLPLMLAFIGGYLRYRQQPKFDNRHPRQQQAQVSGMAARALAAQANSLENLHIFTAMLLVAYIRDIDLAQLDTLAIIYLLARLTYIVCYLTDKHLLRSASFFAGLLCLIAMGIYSL